MRPRSCMAFDGKTSLSAQERTRTLTFCSERLRSFYGERIRRVQGFRISSVIPEDDFRGILWIAVFWNELPHPYLATEKLEENSMQMETENGNLVGSAIRAILEMQSDCIKLFHDLDNKFELNGLQAISGKHCYYRARQQPHLTRFVLSHISIHAVRSSIFKASYPRCKYLFPQPRIERIFRRAVVYCSEYSV